MGRLEFPDISDECRKAWNYAEFEFGRRIGLYRTGRDYLFNHINTSSLYPAVDLFEGGRCIALAITSKDFVERVIRRSCAERLVSSNDSKLITASYYGNMGNNIY